MKWIQYSQFIKVIAVLTFQIVTSRRSTNYKQRFQTMCCLVIGILYLNIPEMYCRIRFTRTVCETTRNIKVQFAY